MVIFWIDAADVRCVCHRVWIFRIFAMTDDVLAFSRPPGRRRAYSLHYFYGDEGAGRSLVHEQNLSQRTK